MDAFVNPIDSERGRAARITKAKRSGSPRERSVPDSARLRRVAQSLERSTFGDLRKAIVAPVFAANAVTDVEETVGIVFALDAQ